ncbi:MAG: M24 family metallopeptidase [Bacteriovorax sp.]|nr:M24 family metallopeptidase [Bacteriovorax sp.]
MRRSSTKLNSVRKLMQDNDIETLLIQRSSNFAWLTNGAESPVSIATDGGSGAILITKENEYILTNNIEAERWQKEQRLEDWEFVISSWEDGWSSSVKKKSSGKIHSDLPFLEAIDISAKINSLRYILNEDELVRYRELGAATGRALQAAAGNVRVGMTEWEIAGLVANHCYANNIRPIVNLIAVDERVFKYGHPLPTEKKMERYAMLVLCTRKFGLIASATRLIHFGSIPDALQRKMNSCARIDTEMIHATREGTTLSDIFNVAQKNYKKEGFKDEWKIHHQGGLTGFQTREILATQETKHSISLNQAFAWNPSIKGTKSEDTILLTSRGIELITQVDEWPLIECNGIGRPDILVL